MSALVSIITPCYNAELFIAKTIDSVLAQSETNWEMMIVDDCSTDASNEIVRSYARRHDRVKPIKLERHAGAYHARNTAIQRAKGRYIAFLDSDDIWLPNKLRTQLAFMAAHQLAFSYASYQLMDGEDNRLGVFLAAPSLTYAALLKHCSVGCLTALYDTHKIGKVYLPNIAVGEDYALWLKILRTTTTTATATATATAKGILEPLAVYRIHGNSLSANKLRAAVCRWRVYRELERLGRAKSLYYFCHYLYHGVTKYKTKTRPAVTHKRRHASKSIHSNH